jgi:hypothetical protein
MTVALRISVVREGNGRYVLGKGSAFGAEMAPRPVAVFVDVSWVAGLALGAGAVDVCPGEAHALTRTASNGREFNRIWRVWDETTEGTMYRQRMGY